MTEDVSVALRGKQKETWIQSWGEWRNRCYQRLQKREHEQQTLLTNRERNRKKELNGRSLWGAADIAAELRNWRKLQQEGVLREEGGYELLQESVGGIVKFCIYLLIIQLCGDFVVTIVSITNWLFAVHI